MKNLLLLTALLTITMNAQASCNLSIKVKKPSSKTFYLTSGEKLTAKNIEKLKTVCTLNVSVMNERQVAELKIKDLMNKLAKAKKELK